MSDHECVRCIRCDSCPVCAADALDREVEETDRLRLAIAEATRECQRLRDMIEIEREGQRSMAGALAEIRRLSDLNVTINRPALSRARETEKPLPLPPGCTHDPSLVCMRCRDFDVTKGAER